MTSRAAGLAACVVLALALPACAGSDGGGATGGVAADSLRRVATLRFGTIQSLRERRGQGPSRVYPVSPDAMLDVLSRAAAKARGLGGRPVSAIFVNAAAREVIAKERAPEDAGGTRYAPDFRSAMIAAVSFVPGRGDASRVEIHALQSGPFHGGAVQWERDMPRWIDEVLEEDRRGGPAVKPIP